MKIPDDVFENRCRYCVHGITENENKDVPDNLVWNVWASRNASCRVFGLAQCDEIPGECKCFTPHPIFGICATCEYDNSFASDFCTKEKQPNKRQVYIGYTYGNKEYWKHRLCTCDNYKPSRAWIVLMKKYAAEGMIPRNFDPETMKPTGPVMSNETAERWAAVDQKKAAEEAVKKEKQEATKMERAEQLSLFA